MHQGSCMVTLHSFLLLPFNLWSLMLGGWPNIIKSSIVEVECMMVNNALALIESSLGRDLDLFFSQISLAILLSKLTIKL